MENATNSTGRTGDAPSVGGERSAIGAVPGERELSVSVGKLNHAFGEGETRKQVLFDNNLDLTPGEVVIMTGPSGSGKTTLLTLIGGLRTVQDGSVKVLGTELNGLGARELVEVREKIGFIFQAHNLFRSLTALQNVSMSMELQGYDRATIRQRAEELLTALGLGRKDRKGKIDYHKKPHELSGGMKQRVAIARALASKPKLILADEPTAALDKESGRTAVDLLRNFATAEKATILIVTHDNRILHVADRIVNMVDGHVTSNVVVAESTTIAESLRGCPLFASFSADTLSKVADKVTLERFDRGAAIIRQGDPGEKFYVIRKGEAEVIIRDANGERVAASLGAGNFFGEAALMTGEPRNATVCATEDIELYTLGKGDFRAVVAASPPFEQQLREALFKRQ